MRVALNDLAQIVPDWLARQAAPEWFDRYHRLPEGYKMSETKRQALFEQIGTDGMTLLAAIYDADTGVIQLAALPQVEILRRIWLQQFYLEAAEIKKRKTGNQPPASVMISSPYDGDARLSSKREHEWRGYKVHLTETVVEDGVQLITDVLTTTATLTDKEALPEIQTELEKRDLSPETQLVDAGYVTARQIVESREKYGIDLFGPMMRDPSWQAKAGKGFAGSDFSIDWENKHATCPRGKQSSHWRQVRAADYDMEVVYIEFLKSDCSICPARADCTTSKTQRRRVTISAQPYYEAIQNNRKRQESEEFRQEYQQRAGVEGTISQGVRAFELRKTRYRGLAKTRLQHFATATAMNIARLGAWWAGVPREKTRESAFQ